MAPRASALAIAVGGRSHVRRSQLNIPSALVPCPAAGGDPLPTGIVLWTRITPRTLITSYTPIHKWPSFLLNWTIYSDAAITKPVQTGVYNATRDHDYTVKGARPPVAAAAAARLPVADRGGGCAVYADGLAPASEYWFNFNLVNGSEVSQTGHFKCAPPRSRTGLRHPLAAGRLTDRTPAGCPPRPAHPWTR